MQEAPAFSSQALSAIEILWYRELKAEKQAFAMAVLFSPAQFGNSHRACKVLWK
jgi:hypothetical protein